MWASPRDWLGRDVGVIVSDGLLLALTEQEEALLTVRAARWQEAGAPLRSKPPKRGPMAREEAEHPGHRTIAMTSVCVIVPS
jgi:hypothetical protein